MPAPVTVNADANTGYVWDLIGSSAWGTAIGTSVPHGNMASPWWMPHYDFNWPTLPDGANIISATLNVYWSGGLPAYSDAGNQATSVQVYQITAGSWTEGGSKPVTGGAIGNLPMGSGAGWVSDSVTTFVREKYAGQAKYGVTWGNADYRDSSVSHHGKDQVNKPYVAITYYIPGGYHMML